MATRRAEHKTRARGTTRSSLRRRRRGMECARRGAVYGNMPGGGGRRLPRAARADKVVIERVWMKLFYVVAATAARRGAPRPGGGRQRGPRWGYAGRVGKRGVEDSEDALGHTRIGGGGWTKSS